MAGLTDYAVNGSRRQGGCFSCNSSTCGVRSICLWRMQNIEIRADPVPRSVSHLCIENFPLKAARAGLRIWTFLMQPDSPTQQHRLSLQQSRIAIVKNVASMN
jgi:hypothetical protein